MGRSNVIKRSNKKLKKSGNNVNKIIANSSENLTKIIGSIPKTF